MRIRIVLGLLWWVCNTAYTIAGTNKGEVDVPDSGNRLEHLYANSQNALLHDPAEAWPTITEGLTMAKQERDEGYRGKFYYLKGYYLYYHTDSVVETCKAFGNALYWTEQAEDYLTYYKALEYLADYYSETQDLQKGEQYYQACFAYYQEHSDSTSLARLYAKVGVLALDVREYTKAHHYFSLALILRQAENNAYHISSLKNYLGWVYTDTDNPTLAIGLFQEAYAVIHDATDSRSRELKASIQNNLARANYGLGKYELSLRNMQQALAEVPEGASAERKRQFFNNTADKYLALEDWQAAEDILQYAFAQEVPNYSTEVLRTYALAVKAHKYQGEFARALELEEERNGVEQAMQRQQAEQLAELRKVQIATAEAELYLLSQARNRVAQEYRWYGILALLVVVGVGVYGLLTWRYQRLRKRALAEAALWPKLHGQVEELARMLQITD